MFNYFFHHYRLRAFLLYVILNPQILRTIEREKYSSLSAKERRCKVALHFTLPVPTLASGLRDYSDKARMITSRQSSVLCIDAYLTAQNGSFVFCLVPNLYKCLYFSRKNNCARSNRWLVTNLGMVCRGLCGSLMLFSLMFNFS